MTLSDLIEYTAKAAVSEELPKEESRKSQSPPPGGGDTLYTLSLSEIEKIAATAIRKYNTIPHRVKLLESREEEYH